MSTFLDNLGTGFVVFLVGFIFLCLALWVLVKFIIPFLNELADGFKALKKTRPRDILIGFAILSSSSAAWLIAGKQSMSVRAKTTKLPRRFHPDSFSPHSQGHFKQRGASHFS